MSASQRLDRHMASLLSDVDGWLADADAASAAFPGEPARRQPVHTVYAAASAYSADLPARWGTAALKLLQDIAPDTVGFAEAMGLDVDSAEEVQPRVVDQLERRPIEDLRVDFEDGYGVHPDADEDLAALTAGRGLAGADAVGDPFMCGVRIKSLEPHNRARALRTLDLVLRGATDAGGLPERFVVTVPKVSHLGEVQTMMRVCERLEDVHGLGAGRLRMELQIELPRAIVGPDGTATVARLLHAAAGRCEGLHYGTYDFSAASGVAAGEQSLAHPLADHAKAVMQLAAAQTGVRVSDGSTNVLPVGDPDQVRAAWRLHAGLVGRSLRRGIYQGWDMHPGHLPSRYAATYAFLRTELASNGARLRAYLERSSSGVLDEPATAQALAAAVARGLDCGACDDAEVSAATGLDRPALDRLVRRE